MAHRTPSQVAVTVLVLSVILAACGPRCPDDGGAYRIDPKTGSCVDIGEEYWEAEKQYRAEEAYQEYLDSQHDAETSEFLAEEARQDYLGSIAGEDEQDSLDGESGEGTRYIVQPGDTLGKIGAAYGVSVKAITQANHISNPILIYPGLKLLIPNASRPTSLKPPSPLWMESPTASSHSAGATATAIMPPIEASTDEIDCDAAGSYMWQNKCVRAKVEHVITDSTGSYLTLNDCTLQGAAFRGRFEPWVAGCDIRICGFIDLANGKPRIVVSNQAQLQAFCPPPTTPAPAPATRLSTPPPPPTATALPPAAPTTGCPDGCTVPPPGCVIKGNIKYQGTDRIYHLPGCDYYDQTKISPEDGERWFCTEDEARANGWRKASNCP